MAESDHCSRCDTEQGMVPRAELLAAQSEARANRDDADARARDAVWMEDQLSKAREQLNVARTEAGRVHAALGDSVPRSELAAIQAAAARQQEVAGVLRESVQRLEEEKAALQERLQVDRVLLQ